MDEREYKNLGWDATITNDGEEYVMVPPGNYDFEIINLEKTKTTKGANMAKLTLRVYDDKVQGSISDNIVLNEKCEWKISQFFRSIGMKKRGVEFKMDWDNVVGKKGRLKVKKDFFTGRDGTEKESRAVERYHDPAQIEDDVPW